MTIPVLTAWAAAGLVRRLRTYFERRRRLRSASALHALSDHMLKDCGVSRSEIDWVALHGRRSSYAPDRAP